MAAGGRPTYRSLFAVRGFGALAAATLLGRTAQSMVSVVMVLFILQRFHSPGLAGLSVFLGLAPGLTLSPLAGALLDRHGRARLILLDYAVAATSLALIALLSVMGRLDVTLLLPLVLLGGVTGMLSAAGVRSLVPLMLPPHLWTRGNAADSAGYTVTSIVGPALAGVVVGAVGPEAALTTAAVMFGLGGVSLLRLSEPRNAPRPGERLLTAAWEGLRYVVRHPVLRTIAVSLTAINIGSGVALVAMPVLALQVFHASPSTVGFILALEGASGSVMGLVFGRLRSEGRERAMILGAVAVMAVGTFIVAVSPSMAVLVVGALVVGAAIGPFDVTIFSLRQRTVPVAWFGRAIAVSMSLNFAGMPIGSGLAGLLIAVDLRFALGFAVVATVVGGLAAALLLPRDERIAALVEVVSPD